MLKTNAKIVLIVSVAISAAVICASCGDDKSPEVRENERLVEAIARLEIGFKMAKEDNVSYVLVRDSILAELGADSAWLADEMENMQNDPDRWLVLWEQVTERLSTLRDSVTP